MRYTLELIVVSIGIIGFFQLVSILTFIVYSYIFVYVCMLSIPIVSILIGIKFFIHILFMLKLVCLNEYHVSIG